MEPQAFSPGIADWVIGMWNFTRDVECRMAWKNHTLSRGCRGSVGLTLPFSVSAQGERCWPSVGILPSPPVLVGDWPLQTPCWSIGLLRSAQITLSQSSVINFVVTTSYLWPDVLTLGWRVEQSCHLITWWWVRSDGRETVRQIW